MRHFARTVILFVFALAAASSNAQAQQAKPSANAEPRTVIPFDFESKFDDGRYGQIIGDVIWKKVERRGGFVIPESMLDVRDWCQRNRLVPGPETPIQRMKEIVRKDFDGDIAIWGKVERVAGFETDVYDLWIYVFDFSTDPPTELYHRNARTESVSEIPHVYVKEAIDRLYGETPAPARPPDPGIEERWEKAPNLVTGNFDEGKNGPSGWEQPGQHVTWTLDGESSSKNRIIRFSFPEDVAGTTGVLYYSDFFPVEEGATYRFQCRWRTTGSAAKVFIKCYDEMPSKYSRSTDGSPGVQRREVYRSQQNLKGQPATWNVHTEDFTPKHTQYTPRWGRIMLYAYWPAGTVEWDDVVVKQVVQPPANTKPKEQRPSLETKVRTKDLPKK